MTRSAIRLSVSLKDPVVRRRFHNASLHRKVEVKRWLRRASAIVTTDIERQLAEAIIYGRSFP